MAKLLIQESAGAREFELVDQEVSIGRELDNALRLSDPSISRHHCVVRRSGEGYEIEDLQSANGVLLNGNKVASSPLQDGDRITLGQLQITFSDPVAVPAPPAEEPGGSFSPLGTVRMNPEDMARFQAAAGGAASASEPPSSPVSPVSPPVAPPLPPPPVPQAFQAVRAEDNPAPSFLQAWLPPVPDDAEPTGERGDFGTRLVACLIDSAILMVPLIVCWFAMAILTSMFRGTPALILGLGCLGGLLQLALSVGYLVFTLWCWVKFGATPGKKIMKLRVVPEDDPTGRINMGTAILRAVGHMLNFTIGYLLILGNERKGVQDYLSKSIVIKVDR